MAARIELHSRALEELEEAFGWYLLRSPASAEAFLQEVDRAFAVIRLHPDAWAPFEVDTRRFQLRRFPFYVIYRRHGNSIVVVAIAHRRRRPGYWKP